MEVALVSFVSCGEHLVACQLELGDDLADVSVQLVKLGLGHLSVQATSII